MFDSSSSYEDYGELTSSVTQNNITYTLFEDSTAVIVDCDTKEKTLDVPSSITIDDNIYTIKDIGKRAFKNTQLEEITFLGDSSVSRFQRDSLFCQTLKKLNLSLRIKKLDCGWCNFTINVNEITIDENNKYFIVENGVLYNTKKTILYFCPRNRRSIIIPKTVEVIAGYAFEQCRRLKSVEFEAGSCIKSIHPWAFSHSRLPSISIPKSLQTISYDAFFWCKRLREVEFEKGSQLTEILYGAFKDTGLIEIKLPKTTRKIGPSAFRNCERLISVKLFRRGKLELWKKIFENVNKSFKFVISTETEVVFPERNPLLNLNVERIDKSKDEQPDDEQETSSTKETSSQEESEKSSSSEESSSEESSSSSTTSESSSSGESSD